MLCATVFATTAWPQQVYRCTENGRTTYSQMPCTEGSVRIINATPNTIDHSGARELHERQKQRDIQEQEIKEARAARAQEQLADIERQELFKRATTVLPGAKGLTRGQREAAASLARTSEERDFLMREATSPIPGSKGLTASQLDTARRINAVNAGHLLPPPAPPPPVPEPPESPSVRVNCDSAGCWDTSGRRLTSVAGGNYQRSDGKFCTPAGPNIICH